MKRTGAKKEESCKIIRGLKSLNVEGCKFFIYADSTQETFISSMQLRWLTHGVSDKDGYFTKEQKRAIDKINKASSSKEINTSELRIKILLYDDPRKCEEAENKYIKKLLNCGGTEIRYLRTKESKNLRLSIQGRKLFLSVSESQERKVHEGFLYQSGSDNNPLLNYYKSEFNKEFSQAKKIELKNDVIVYADNCMIRFVKWLTVERIISIISVMITIIFGCLTL